MTNDLALARLAVLVEILERGDMEGLTAAVEAWGIKEPLTPYLIRQIKRYSPSSEAGRSDGDALALFGPDEASIRGTSLSFFPNPESKGYAIEIAFRPNGGLEHIRDVSEVSRNFLKEQKRKLKKLPAKGRLKK